MNRNAFSTPHSGNRLARIDRDVYRGADVFKGRVEEHLCVGASN